MVGSARTVVVPGICRNTRFCKYGADSAYNLVLSTVKIKQQKRLKSWNVMHNDAKVM